MEKVVSFTICIILVLQYIKGGDSLRCCTGTDIKQLTIITCTGSCFAERFFDYSSKYFKYLYGCTMTKQDAQCYKGLFSVCCYCNEDLCNYMK